nr:DNA recombination protein RmuC [Chthonobacter albigriseus]
MAALFAFLAFVAAGRSASGAARVAETQERLDRLVRDEFARGRQEAEENARRLREEVGGRLTALGDALLRQAGETARQQTDQGDVVNRSLERFADVIRLQTRQMVELHRAQQQDFGDRLTKLMADGADRGEALRQTVEGQLANLRKENGEKLDQMRVTVDEKLQGTLEQRLGASFQIVSERLEAVHKGLGEVQSLATGVGDLKRVLTNVKVRGTWGEVQLGALLEQILAPHQYTANVVTADIGSERVEYAVRLPGSGDGMEVLLPIDAKFPVEDFERLQAASEIGDPAGVEAASRGLEARIRQQARDISTKYVHPPRTTDFAILFLPTEGLFAEVIRRAGLVDELQRQHRIVIAGPTTLTALLSSLQMGFRTLAIQERSSEVWQVLGAVKTEFGKFGPVLEKVKKKLQEATNTIDQAGIRERAIQRKLRRVETLPSLPTADLIGDLGLLGETEADSADGESDLEDGDLLTDAAQ